MRNFGLGKLEERKASNEQLVPGLNVDLPSNAFDADGDLNLLAFIPIELQGTIESVLKLTTAILLVAFILAGVRCLYPNSHALSMFLSDIVRMSQLRVVNHACVALSVHSLQTYKQFRWPSRGMLTRLRRREACLSRSRTSFKTSSNPTSLQLGKHLKESLPNKRLQ